MSVLNKRSQCGLQILQSGKRQLDNKRFHTRQNKCSKLLEYILKFDKELVACRLLFSLE